VRTSDPKTFPSTLEFCVVKMSESLELYLDISKKNTSAIQGE
jgi:hypothetical protein